MKHRRHGFSLIEVAIVVGLIGALAAIAAPSLSRWSVDQRLKAAGRTLAGAFTLARSEAIRTGNNHIVFFQTDASGNPLTDGGGNPVPALVIDDGRPGDPNQNCQIDAGERVAIVQAESSVAWGVSDATAQVPSDAGGGVMTTGSTFRDPGTNPASWILFRPEGTPLAFSALCATGAVGSGAGGVYLTNGRKDYAIVVTALGAVRVHSWNGANGQWTN